MYQTPSNSREFLEQKLPFVFSELLQEDILKVSKELVLVLNATCDIFNNYLSFWLKIYKNGIVYRPPINQHIAIKNNPKHTCYTTQKLNKYFVTFLLISL